MAGASQAEDQELGPGRVTVTPHCAQSDVRTWRSLGSPGGAGNSAWMFSVWRSLPSVVRSLPSWIPRPACSSDSSSALKRGTS
jgi:hypothetical protein